VPVSEEMLRRLVALKTSFERHPGVVTEIIQGLKPGAVTDAIAQLIEPIEQRMRQADEKLAKAREKSITDALAKGQRPPTTGASPQKDPHEPAKPQGDKPTGKGPSSSNTGTGIDPAAVRELRMNDLLGVLEAPHRRHRHLRRVRRRRRATCWCGASRLINPRWFTISRSI
jgi:hypothetical protein